MNDLKKEYHILDLQERIVRDVVLNIELLINDKNRDISEYQIQEFILQFLRRNLDKNKYLVGKEKFGRFDISIEEKDAESPLFLFELKTYAKPKEVLQTITQHNKIEKDFKKLKKGIIDFNCRGYFILVCKDKDVTKNLEKFNFVYERLNNSKKWIINDKYKLRPSRKSYCARTYCFSWEVK